MERFGSLQRWLIAIAACLLLTLLLAGYKFYEIRGLIAFAESFPEQSETVNAVYAQLAPFSQTIKTTGQTVAQQNVLLHNELGGIIDKVGFVPGGSVKAGQVLLQLTVAEEKAQLKSAEANEQLARLALQRIKALRSKGLSSQAERDRANAQLAMTEAQSEALRVRIHKKTLRAPFDGQISLAHFQRGEYLAANSPVAQLVGIDHRVWVDFSLPQHQIIPLNTLATISAQGVLAHSLSAKVIAANPTVSSSSRQRKYRLAIDADTDSSLATAIAAEPKSQKISAHVSEKSVNNKPAIALLSGTFVEINILLASTTNATLLPHNALVRDAFGTTIFILKPDPEGNGYRAEKTAVTIIGMQGDYTAINEHFSRNILIATAGAYKLKTGLLTFIAEPSPLTEPSPLASPPQRVEG